MKKMIKQRLLGAVLVTASVMVVALATQGTTPEERDITPAVPFLPIGIYMMATKKSILDDDINIHERSQTMARKRIIEAPALKSWEEADAALREIAEEEITLQDIENEMQRQIIGVKKIAEQDSKPHADRIAKLERDLKEFTENHRDDLGKAKTKVLNFGEVGYRLSTSVSLPKAKERIAEIIRKLKARKMNDCIVIDEKISKENLKKYGMDTVEAVGATWKQKDAFGYDVYTEKLERLKSGMV